jgi:hypothetical protein
MLTVLVGNEQHKFQVHEGIICARSRFFKSAVKPHWTRSNRDIKLPADDPSQFEDYLSIVYMDKVPVLGTSQDDDQFSILAGLYILADKLIDVQSKNLIAKAMIKRGEENAVPSGGAIYKLYVRTPASSPARRLFVDLYADGAGLGRWDKDVPVLLREFLIDLGRTFITRQDQRRGLRNPPKKPHDRAQDYMEKEPPETRSSGV